MRLDARTSARPASSALEAANWQVASALTDGDLNPADASAMKVFGTELRVDALRALMDVVGESASLGRRRAAALRGQLEAAYRQAPVGTFGGGVNEVQREIIALAGWECHTPALIEGFLTVALRVT